MMKTLQFFIEFSLPMNRLIFSQVFCFLMGNFRKKKFNHLNISIFYIYFICIKIWIILKLRMVKNSFSPASKLKKIKNNFAKITSVIMAVSVYVTCLVQVKIQKQDFWGRPNVGTDTVHLSIAGTECRKKNCLSIQSTSCFLPYIFQLFSAFCSSNCMSLWTGLKFLTLAKILYLTLACFKNLNLYLNQIKQAGVAFWKKKKVGTVTGRSNHITTSTLFKYHSAHIFKDI